MGNETVKPPNVFKPVVIENIASSHKLESDGTYTPTPCKSSVMAALANGANHMASNTCRVIFSQSQDPWDLDQVGADPLYRWRYDDGITNARAYRAGILTGQGTTSGGLRYAARYGGGATEQTGKSWSLSSTTLGQFFPQKAWHYDYLHTRTGAAPGEQEEGLSTFNGFLACDVCIQDVPRNMLIPGLDDYVPVPGPSIGAEVIEAYPETIRDVVHESRTTNLPIIMSWGAQLTGTGGYAYPSSQSTRQGFRIIGASYTSMANILDPSFSSNTSNSPGTSIVTHKKGRANVTSNDHRLKVQCRVLAECVGAASGTIRFEGQTTTDLTIPVTGSPAWYGTGGSNYVYLQTNTGSFISGTPTDKLDVLAQIANPTDIIYIWGIMAWAEYS